MNYITLKEASKNSPYSADYLSLLVRKNKISGNKIDGKWMTTQAAVEEYTKKIAQANYIHQENMNIKIPEVEQRKALVNFKWALVLAIILIIIIAAWGFDFKNKTNQEYIIQKDANNNLTIQVDDPSSIGSITIVPKK